MAMKTAAQMLDELMGKHRNTLPEEVVDVKGWREPNICKHFICGFCPHDLFTNTKSDLGACPKVHDEILKREYEQSDDVGQMRYEDDFLAYLQQIMSDVDRRIRRGHSRLALSNSQQSALSVPNRSKDEEKIKLLSDRIGELLVQVEELGCNGMVEEAQGVMKLMEQLKAERDDLQQQTEQAMDAILSQEKQMEVCEVCGAFLIVGDAQSRVDDHLMGKQHMGYAKIKATIEEIKKKRNAPYEERERQRAKEREEREKKMEEEREERKKRREEREKEREKEREERRKKREEERLKEEEKEKEREKDRSSRKSRSRSRDRRRSRSRDRKRSRSRDRKRRRSRSRDRRRSRSRDRRRRSRSRSRDRRRRSRSRDRRRRSRSRSRTRRSRSRDRRRSRDRDHDRKRRSRSHDRDDKDRKSRDRDDKEKERSKDRDERERSKDRDERERSKDRDERERSREEDDKKEGENKDDTIQKTEGEPMNVDEPANEQAADGQAEANGEADKQEAENGPIEPAVTQAQEGGSPLPEQTPATEEAEPKSEGDTHSV